MTYLKVNENPKTMDVPRTIPRVRSAHNLTVIEWEMLDKKKFFPLSMMSSFTVRCFLYPLTLIRTRLQVKIIAMKCVRKHYNLFVYFLFRFSTKMQCTVGHLMPTRKFHRQRESGVCTEGSGYHASRYKQRYNTIIIHQHPASMYLFLGGIRNILRFHIRGSSTYSRQEWSAGSKSEGHVGWKLC